MLTRSRVAATGCAALLTAAAFLAKHEEEHQKSVWTRPQPAKVRQAVIEHYHFVVRRVVKNVLNRLRIPERIGAEEIVSDLYETYCRALDRFDPARGVQVETYLDRRLRWATIDWLRGRISAERRLQLAEEEFRAQPSPSTSARLAAMRSEASVAKLVSLEDSVGIDTTRSLAQIVPLDEPAPAPCADWDVVRERLRYVLLEREWSVLALIHMLGGSVRQVARILGITPSHVHGEYREALRRARAEQDWIDASSGANQGDADG